MKKLYAPLIALALIIHGTIYFNSYAQQETGQSPVTYSATANPPGEEHSAGEKKEEHEGGMEPLFFVIIALIVGAATRHFLRKSPLPYTVMLMIIGLLAGVAARMHYFHNFHSFDKAIDWAGNIDPHLILFVFLPTLIFEAAFALDIHTFKKSVANAAILAVPGIIIALGLTAGLMVGLHSAGIIDWGVEHWAIALMFGSVISATDPVAVTALLKELGASKKLGTLIEGESMLNDGTAIVFFMVFYLPLAGMAGDSSALADFVRVSFGGILIGLIIAAVSVAWVKRVFNDAMVEISVIVCAAYITFYIAEGFLHVSGVLGLVSLGLVMAGAGRTRISPEVEHFLHEFWELAAFIANTLIFIIVGVVIAQKAVFSAGDFIILGIVYAGVHVIRALMIIVLYPFMRKTGYGLPVKDGIVLWYGALRGAIALALALVVAGVDDKYISAPVKSQFLFLIAGTVLLTLLVNATTIKFLLRKLGMTEIPAVKKLMMSNVFRFVTGDTESALNILKGDKFMSGANWNSVRDFLPRPKMPQISEAELASMDTTAESRRRILEKEQSSYWNQFKDGLLGATAVQRLSQGISEMLDHGGRIPLSERKYLDHLWATPKILSSLQTIPVLNAFTRTAFSERLSMSYDIAKGFIVAQEEVGKLVKSFASQGMESSSAGVAAIEEEINHNRIRGLTFLKNLREAYPEIAAAIETKQAIRSVLNHERNTIKKMQKDGRIDADEAASMVSDVEKRMQKLMFQPTAIKLPDTVQLLQEITWLQGLDDSTFAKVLNLAQSKNYSSGSRLMEQGDAGDGMFIIARGTVKVTVGNFLVDILGAGSVIGEMAVLLGVPRTATVTAESPVTALWLASSGMREIMKDSKTLEEQLWKTAGTRFCENFLGKLEPWQQWTQIELRRWLSEGNVIDAKSSDTINLTDKIAVVISGQVFHKEMTISSPALLKSGEVKFLSDGRAWVR